MGQTYESTKKQLQDLKQEFEDRDAKIDDLITNFNQKIVDLQDEKAQIVTILAELDVAIAAL